MKEHIISVVKFAVMAVVVKVVFSTTDININHTFVDKHYKNLCKYNRQSYDKNPLQLKVNDGYLKIENKK
jgi:hypothetical protein